MNNGKDSWDAIVDLCENNKMPEQWGYDVDASGKKILAKNFVVSNTTIYDFTIYRLEQMIDDAWNDHVNNESDAYVLAEILEAYLDGMVSIEPEIDHLLLLVQPRERPAKVGYKKNL